MSWLKRPNIFRKKDSGEDEEGKKTEEEDKKDDAAEAGGDGDGSKDENSNNEALEEGAGGGGGGAGGTSTPTPGEAGLPPRAEAAGSAVVRDRIQPPLLEDSENDVLEGGMPPQKQPLGGGGMLGPAEDEEDGRDERGVGEEEEDDEDKSEEDSETDDEDDDDDDDVAAPPLEGMYDPSEFESLNVSPEIRELFSHIMRYTPQTVDLETRFKPFIPEYIPAVGDIDAFIKVPRPDAQQESLGLSVLDEPSALQSDPSVLELQLRAISKQSSAKQAQVKTVDGGGGAERQGKVIEKWIKDISDLHRSKPPPTVHYSRPMPDIDSLMQEWPPEVEEMLKETGVPTAEFDCDLASYVDVCCAVLDIPVYKNRVQSLHVLFSLYSAFRNSQHFNQLAQENQMDNQLKQEGGGGEQVERLDF